jgi:hypothetical protein
MSETCWFDYEAMGKDERCAHFAEAYSNAYRAQYARRIDVRRAPFITPITGMKNGDIGSLSESKRRILWRATSAADRIGVTYPFYCESLMEYYAKRSWTHLPRLQQLYSSDGIEFVREAWQSHLVREAELPHPRAASGARFAIYLRHIVGLRERPRYLISLLIKRLYLTEGAAIALFGEDLVMQAQRVNI